MENRSDGGGGVNVSASWLVKYEPRSLDEMALPPDTRILLEEYVGSGDIPNLFVAGPAGIGKSTVARVLTRILPCNLFVLDASRDRGVETIRDQVNNFTRAMPWPGKRWRIAVCEEADGLTRDAQLALRNVMDRAADTTRFILTANYPNKVIEPLRSRCFILDLEQTPADERARILLRILEAEGVTHDTEAVKTRAERFTDIRQLMIEAEHCTRLHGALTPWRPEETQVPGRGAAEATVPGADFTPRPGTAGSVGLTAEALRKLLPGPRRKRERLQLIYQQLRACPATVKDLERQLKEAGTPVPGSTLNADVVVLEELGLVACDSGFPRTWSVAR